MKDGISKMVIWSGGGLSQLEEFQILRDSSLKMPPECRESYKKMDEIVKTVRENPDTVDHFYFGHPYIRWNSFFDYRPMDHLKDIECIIQFYKELRRITLCSQVG